MAAGGTYNPHFLHRGGGVKEVHKFTTILCVYNVIQFFLNNGFKKMHYM